MADGVWDWLVDFSRYGNLLWTRIAEPKLGRGIDWQRRDLHAATRRAVERLHPKRMRLEVTDLVQETPSTTTVEFRRLDGRFPPFRPGQYVNLFVTIDGVRTSRPYSISSAPQTATMALTVREIPEGFVSTWLCHDLKVGDRLESTGPQGDFVHEPLFHGDDLVYIAGGSGITPFLAALRDAERRSLEGRQVHLLYGSRRADDVIFERELQRLEEALDWFTWELLLSEPDEGEGAFIDRPHLEAAIDEPTKRTFYLCGPAQMIGLVDSALADLGVPKRRIVREHFGPPADVTAEPGWPAELSGTKVFEVKVEGREAVEARASEPLMNTLERHGIVLPTQCRNGHCSACSTQVLDGEVFVPQSVHPRETQRREGYVHACTAYPMSDLVLRLPPGY